MYYLCIIVLLILIVTVISEFSLYQISSDPPVNNFLPNQTISLTCVVDLTRGGQTDIVWYRRFGKIWLIIGNGDYLNNFFHTSRYTLTRKSMSKLEIVYTLEIKDLKVEDSGAIYCTGYKNIPESLTPFILNICNNLESSYCKCMSKEMSTKCALDILSRESDYRAMERACIALAVCLAIMLLISLVLTILVLRRDCTKSDDSGSASNLSTSRAHNSRTKLCEDGATSSKRSILKTHRASEQLTGVYLDESTEQPVVLDGRRAPTNNTENNARLAAIRNRNDVLATRSGQVVRDFPSREEYSV